MNAIILAAGLGLRLSSYYSLPKGLISLGGVTLIDRSITLLKQNNINNILVITGYKAKAYQTQLKNYKGVDIMYNPRYAETGSMYTFFLAKEWVTEEFLLLESDIIYPSYSLKALIDCAYPDAILVSGKTNSGDEVYVEQQQGYLTNLSKNKNDLKEKQLLGEFVGISKFSVAAYRDLIMDLENSPINYSQQHYETYGLVKLAQIKKIYCSYIDTLLWSEIDTLKQWEQAKKIYPLIENK